MSDEEAARLPGGPADDDAGEPAPVEAPTPAKGGGVQSLTRGFTLLEALADAGGRATLSQLAASTGLPMGTLHRIVRTLVDLGYVRQEPSRQYTLGPRLLRLGETTTRLLDTWARPHLADLVAATGESANLAILEGDEVVYVSQAQSTRAMRMFTEVGRRVTPHCTAVGKAVLADLAVTAPDEVAAMIRRTGLPTSTPYTITDDDAFFAELRLVAERGYAIDEEEQELGVRCVAVVVPGAPSRMGMSVSGPVTRMTDEVLASVVPRLQRAASSLAADLSPAGR